MRDRQAHGKARHDTVCPYCVGSFNVRNDYVEPHLPAADDLALCGTDCPLLPSIGLQRCPVCDCQFARSSSTPRNSMRSSIQPPNRTSPLGAIATESSGRPFGSPSSRNIHDWPTTIAPSRIESSQTTIDDTSRASRPDGTQQPIDNPYRPRIPSPCFQLGTVRTTALLSAIGVFPVPVPGRHSWPAWLHSPHTHRFSMFCSFPSLPCRAASMPGHVFHEFLSADLIYSHMNLRA